VCDAVVGVGVVCFAGCLGVRVVVEQNTTARDAMFGPVVNGEFEIGCGARDVIAFCVVVECSRWNM
jgi:hypothetical protein